MRKAVGTLAALMCISVSGCGIMKDAKQAFDDDINGFKEEWVRVVKNERTN